MDLPGGSPFVHGIPTKEELLLLALQIKARKFGVPVKAMIRRYGDDLHKARELDEPRRDFYIEKNAMLADVARQIGRPFRKRYEGLKHRAFKPWVPDSHA
ncbi:hypothetical protein A5648_02455 [Mycolicibacter sinensis]|uniref:Uncharacterized protein n=1 Tax=Mycolicibacter sinensis (strain JDM601) TaxID=875328 RepID=A0A1A3TYD4_MYCSD|nr:hypothetical protein A5648_02455 [Mycolicibacter sinensis]